MKNKKGFTLVELLVVIAIIGILSSVAVVNLNSARDKAKRAAVLATVAGLSPVIQLCLDASPTANLDASNMLNTGALGTGLCSDASITTVWPAISQHGFNYDNKSLSSSASDGTWDFHIGNGTVSAAGINCTEAGCN